ncbi:hypothetical protein BDZ94DRAFT_1219396 [Collybia nuda]|uniref:Protein-S-isoprenylcysteine O-methyltransferase n=1 Tax=Collybia nuda TaxID=64659 RepID=A0A9P5Y7V1_9AGAR|nr:hypothetical protein BDZ94DRAFT_1219396 [Collybia nuda]
MYEPFVKLPCVLLATLGLHISFTPPGVSSEKDEAPIQNGWDRYLKTMIKLLKPIKGVLWAICAAEIINIVATNFTLSRHLVHILSTLFLYGSAQNLYLTPLSAVGVLLIVFGTLLQLQCHRVMMHLFTFEHAIRIDHNLIITGPYNVVRHPGYAGLLVTYIGAFLWYGSEGSWLRESGILETLAGRTFFAAFALAMVGLLFGLLKRMRAEDGALKEVYGYEWVEWTERVQYSLIPYLY